jgi:hypothetical protein
VNHPERQIHQHSAELCHQKMLTPGRNVDHPKPGITHILPLFDSGEADSLLFLSLAHRRRDT